MAWWAKVRGVLLPQSASEARGTAVFVLVVVACVAPGVYRLITKPVPPKSAATQTTTLSSTDSLRTDSRGKYGSAGYTSSGARRDERYDPNNTSVEELRGLGLSEKQARAYLNYLATGAKFQSTEDLRRLRVLYPNQAERLMRAAEFGNQKQGGGRSTYAPYSTEDKGGSYPGEQGSTQENQGPAYEAPFLVKLKVLDLNLADSADFEALPGIGEKTAGRLVQFRESLGGFYSVGQLADVYGVDSTNYNKAIKWLKVEEGTAIKPIKLNSMTEDVLKKHPYVRWRTARALIAYREKHGAYTSIEEVRQAYPPLTDAQWVRLKRYLAL